MVFDLVASVQPQDVSVVEERPYVNLTAQKFVRSLSEWALGNYNTILPQFIAASGKKAEPDQVLNQLKKEVSKDEFISKWAQKYEEFFTNSELDYLTANFESPITKKFYEKQAETLAPYSVDLMTSMQQILQTYPDLETEVAEESDEEESSFSLESITEENYENLVLNSEIPVIIKVYGATCPPCKILAPIFHELGSSMAGKIKFVELDARKEMEIAKKLNITALPTLIFVKKGKVVNKVVGLIQKNDLLLKIIDSFII